LMTSRNDTRIATVDEMLSRDFNLISDSMFSYVVQKFHGNSSWTENLQPNPDLYQTRKFHYEIAASNNSVLIMLCNLANDFFYTKNYEFKYGHIADSYYILPEKVFTLYDMLPTTRFSPFAERLGEFSLRIFESGIKQHWNVWLHTLSDEIDLQQISIDKEENMFKMDDLKYIFYICGIGLTVASTMFAVELLWFRNRARIMRTCIGRIIRKITLEERRQRKEREEQMRLRRRYGAVIEEETFEMINCVV
jgi:hypothetical protein